MKFYRRFYIIRIQSVAYFKLKRELNSFKLIEVKQLSGNYQNKDPLIRSCVITYKLNAHKDSSNDCTIFDF